MNRLQNFQTAARQGGASLFVVLMLLLIMTLLGLAALRGTLLEERMSANLYDRSVSFQAAEAALRFAETLAAAQPAGDAVCSNGICSTPVASDPDRWLSPSFGGWRDVTSDLALGTIAPQTDVIVENMGLAPTWPGCDRKIPIDALCMAPRYRITARSSEAGRAAVFLQTNFIVR
ncbi:PilX N-terminal domain-containing pilus assembly protein [Lysobacter sp. A03]|uniref:pilus assembly PilX family protein n=1 Tax=Lysobacter sp. A03 TaxID=1199154 RepID=UPI0005B6DABF|nr:PilX N-terminal domain-containing pilus assembly protein [Lysobacter sp. A03]KIQ97139.1 Type IV fimbrial biogenesis protein PilX [Lysobacter sp. A03]